ncbi:hypothetical protein OUZ56_016552 [Daphnia magna]|uniref:Uncharacterized protein n=1 Tax=Daphnia magna TaxID=35525 RepID=A0ABR0AQY2_9CRUS|nr:hypothetical protein OUZ56_016552 [Daphnia magna]
MSCFALFVLAESVIFQYKVDFVNQCLIFLNFFLCQLIATYLGLSWVFNIVVPRVAKTNNIRVCNAHFVLGKPF